MAPEQYGTDLHKYFELRTVLDSLEIGALRYYLDAKPDDQEERFDYLTTEMMKIVKHTWAEARAVATVHGTCPDGYVECYGCCVPYNCVG
jgi:hypothetical protein